MIFHGRTDPCIATEILLKNGLLKSEIDQKLNQVWEVYLEMLSKTLNKDSITILPGVKEILQTLKDDKQFVMGLVTGNLEPAAKMKIERGGLDANQFIVGGYGSDHHERNQLPLVALQRARQKYGALN